MEAWIIEQLEEIKEERPMIELPLDSPIPVDKKEVHSESERGVFVIKIYDDDEEES